MSDKVRVYEIAEEAGATSTDIMSKAKDLGIELKSPQSAVSIEEAEEVVNYILTGKSKLLKKKTPPKKPTIIKKEEKQEPVETSTDTKEVVEQKTEAPVEEKPVLAEKTVEQKKTTPKPVLKPRGKIKKVTLNTPEVEVPKEVEAPVAVKKAVVEEKPVEKKPVEEKTIEPVVVKEEPKVEEKKSDVEVKTDETKKPTAKAASGIVAAVVPRRRGLKVVKKAKPRIAPIVHNTSSDSTQKMKSLSELLGNTADLKETYQPRSKKPTKKQAARAQEHGVRLNVQHGDFASSQDSLLGEEVVLLDMGLTDTSKFLQETPRKPQQVKTTRPSAFGNSPRGLKRGKRKKKFKRTVEEVEVTEVTIPENIRVYEFAEKIGKTTGEVITVLFSLGMMVTKNDFLESDELEILGEEFEIEITVKDELEEGNYVEDYHDDEVHQNDNLIERPPVITIMGHVDHGKTSLLDKIRLTKVAAGEAGGITQHVTAYTIVKNNHKITFVDTPGHAAFTAMRARGADITDIIIIVVAADDGVMPQTIEAISHAKQSGKPIIVAVNKIDKETANMDMVKAGMAEQELTPVDWGGDIEFIGVSAHTGEGIEDLLENILIQSELLELQADPTVKAKAAVVESSLEKGRGPVATVIVQNGTLRVGDNIVADTTYGRVKAITNDLGKPVKELLLSETGSILGLGEVPSAGSVLVAQNSDKEAKEIATVRAEHARAKELSKSTKVSLEEMSGLIAEGKIKSLPVIIKADVAGSLEAIKASLEQIKNDEVKVKVLHTGVGGITESDLTLAGASDDCIILGFNVRPTGSVKSKAKADGIQINTYSIIYDLIDDVKDALSGMMSKKVREENTGQAEIRDTFVVPKIGTVAGCMVTDGKVIRGGMARVIRDGVVVYTGKIGTLKRFKDDAKEVANGFECGIMFDKFNDVKVGDFIETFIEIEEDVHIDG
ncbi:MAG: translation initiation factor IF-2 [Campylobacterota bacterium]|nr:translation initiation factor IF-2 [Campylobacterota bacterium]